LLIPVLCLSVTTIFCQSTIKGNLVYVDNKGVLRYTKDNKEAAFFGVNYTTPFAYAFRAQKALNVDLEKAIQQDVYQMSRLGLDAFRVHVWDTEISDSVGNLLQNEHLRLFDFLLAELKKRNIKTIITPIAFWGNGYPERDEATPGFSRKYGKGNATSNEMAIAAQENYLKQLFRHVNPYTKFTYVSDPDVIAVELNNEPSHSGSKQSVTNYINRLVAAMKSVGWTKPLYYNIAQSPFYADAVAKANIDGVSFQWYPTGLVAGHEQKGNLLPNVDHYTIPYDTIPEYRSKSKMVYEFDAADVLQSCMYPAMARSFREAGFQWATQFAYDPTALAYANTEYQTHYLNLLYTPSKAISLLIASKAFHRLPRLKSFGSYPGDSSFDVFRVSYKNGLSEMNTAREFYYSNSTNTKPVDPSRLEHIAGVGNSPVVNYEGKGAYFLDKRFGGTWRLEIMPDAIHIQAPFNKTSLDKEVTSLEWNENRMTIQLNDLRSGFRLLPIDSGNTFIPKVANGSFVIRPGVYLVTPPKAPRYTATRSDKEFVIVPHRRTEMFAKHVPLFAITAGEPHSVSAEITGLDTGTAILEINILNRENPNGKTQTFPFKRRSSTEYIAEPPASVLTPGTMITYRIVLQKGSEFRVFPGNHKENPFGTNIYEQEHYQTFVQLNSALGIFDPNTDTTAVIYPPFKRGFHGGYVMNGEFDGLRNFLQLYKNEFESQLMGFVSYCGDELKGRISEINSFDTLALRARAMQTEPVKVKITLIDKNAFSYSTTITVHNKFQNLKVPLKSLTPDSALLLPRPYPGFLPLWFKTHVSTPPFNLSEVDKIQITVDPELNAAESNKPCGIEVWSIWLESKK
jgi:hypothetical protein